MSRVSYNRSRILGQTRTTTTIILSQKRNLWVYYVLSVRAYRRKITLCFFMKFACYLISNAMPSEADSSAKSEKKNRLRDMRRRQKSFTIFCYSNCFVAIISLFLTCAVPEHNVTIDILNDFINNAYRY